MASFNLTSPKLVSGSAQQYTTSEAISAGDCVLYDSSGGTVSKTASDDSTKYTAVGIALTSADSAGICVVALDGSVVASSALSGQITDTSTTFWVQRAGDIAVYADVASSDYLCAVGVPWTNDTNMLIKILDYGGEQKS